jgi:hypothetical protein
VTGAAPATIAGAAHFMISSHAGEVARRIVDHVHRAEVRATSPQAQPVTTGTYSWYGDSRLNGSWARRVSCDPRVITAGIGGTSAVAARQAGCEVLDPDRTFRWRTVACNVPGTLSFS